MSYSMILNGWGGSILNPYDQLNKQWSEIYYYLHYEYTENVTYQTVRIIEYIEREKDVTVGQIAKFLNVSHNTASEHVKRLIQKGFVQKVRSISDERKVFVLLTDAGYRVLCTNTMLDIEKLKRVFEDMGENEVQSLQRSLALMAEKSKKFSST